MRQLFQARQFSKDIKRMIRRGKDTGKLESVVRQLLKDDPLTPQYHDHPLSGAWRPSRDCHLDPDWILIYTKSPTLLRLERTGTHSDLFE